MQQSTASVDLIELMNGKKTKFTKKPFKWLEFLILYVPNYQYRASYKQKANISIQHPTEFTVDYSNFQNLSELIELTAYNIGLFLKMKMVLTR
jgi:hypothetical protein